MNSINNILKNISIDSNFQHHKFQAIANVICQPDSLVIMLRSNKFKLVCNDTEKWLGTKYNVKKFRESLIQKITNPQCDIKFKKLGLPP